MSGRGAVLTRAKGQVGPDETVTALATIELGRVVVASASAVAADDTEFEFGSVGVDAGQKVTLRLEFSSTSGSITTVYRVGDPGGELAVEISCPDGLASPSSANRGLRAVKFGRR